MPVVIVDQTCNYTAGCELIIEQTAWVLLVTDLSDVVGLFVWYDAARLTKLYAYASSMKFIMLPSLSREHVK